jgi:hypothetical protein
MILRERNRQQARCYVTQGEITCSGRPVHDQRDGAVKHSAGRPPLRQGIALAQYLADGPLLRFPPLAHGGKSCLEGCLLLRGKLLHGCSGAGRLLRSSINVLIEITIEFESMLGRWLVAHSFPRFSGMLGNTAPKLTRISKISKLHCIGVTVFVLVLTGIGVIMGLFGPPFLEERMAGPNSQGLRLVNASQTCTMYPNGTSLAVPVPNCWSSECEVAVGSASCHARMFGPRTEASRPPLSPRLLSLQILLRSFHSGTSSWSWR